MTMRQLLGVSLAVLFLGLGCDNSTGSGSSPTTATSSSGGGGPDQVRIGYSANLTHAQAVLGVDSNDFAKSQQVQVWNSTIAFGYPSLTTNICTGEVGMALEFGGGGNYENHAVGFWGDFVVYQTTSSNVGTTRFGDYVTLRRRPLGADNAGNLFDAFGYGLRSTAGGGTTVDVHYVTWGRPASACNVIGAQPAVAMSAIEPVAPAGPAFAVANNPMVRGSTLTLRFSVPKSMPARLRIYNAAGALVRTLVEGDLAAGDHSAAWNGRSDRNAVMAPGVYFASLDLADTRRTARIVVLP